MSDTRYAQLARDLASRIAAREFALGATLPREVDLAVEYGVSRQTVRSAISELERLGLVSRRRKFGTRVEAEQPSRHYRQSLASVEDLVQFGATHSRVLKRIGDVVVDVALAEMLDCAPGVHRLRISFVRFDGSGSDVPMGWTDVYVDTEDGALAGVADLVRAAPDVLVASLLETHYGRRIHRIRQDIQGCVVPTDLAVELQAEAGQPALRIIRRYLDQDGQVIDIGITTHPAERFTYSAELTREHASGAVS